MGTGTDPEALLDKIDDVTPLRGAGLSMLIGKVVCAVVYDNDISINYDNPINGNLTGVGQIRGLFSSLTVTGNVLSPVTLEDANVGEILIGGKLDTGADVELRNSNVDCFDIIGDTDAEIKLRSGTAASCSTTTGCSTIGGLTILGNQNQPVTMETCDQVDCFAVGGTVYAPCPSPFFCPTVQWSGSFVASNDPPSADVACTGSQWGTYVFDASGRDYDWERGGALPHRRGFNSDSCNTPMPAYRGR